MDKNEVRNNISYNFRINLKRDELPSEDTLKNIESYILKTMNKEGMQVQVNFSYIEYQIKCYNVAFIYDDYLRFLKIIDKIKEKVTREKEELEKLKKEEEELKKIRDLLKN